MTLSLINTGFSCGSPTDDRRVDISFQKNTTLFIAIEENISVHRNTHSVNYRWESQWCSTHDLMHKKARLSADTSCREPVHDAPNKREHFPWRPMLGRLPCYVVNSLAPGKFESKFIYVIFKRISVTDGWGISCELALRWMSLDLTDDRSSLVPVMAWCRQATSHYLSQCWPRSLSSYGVTLPQLSNRVSASHLKIGHP